MIDIELRRRIRQEKHQEFMETVERLKTQLREKEHLPKDFIKNLSTYIENKFAEIAQQLSKLASSQKKIAEWQRIKKMLTVENFLLKSPFIDYCSEEKLNSLSVAQIISLGVEHIGNCMVILWFDKFYKLMDKPLIHAPERGDGKQDQEEDDSKSKDVMVISGGYDQKLFAVLKPFFYKDDHSDLQNVLKGENISKKLIFGDSCNRFVYVFRLLGDHKLISSNKRKVQRWICKHFSYINEKNLAVPFQDKEVYKILTQADYTVPKERRIDIPGLEYK